MVTRFRLPFWYDLHAHFRQDLLLPAMIAEHRRMACAGVVAMPNTKPPVACVRMVDETVTAWSIERYQAMFRTAWPEAKAVIVPLYLTNAVTPAMIADGVRDGLLQACKYYPPHGTTNSEHGAAFKAYAASGVFAAMEEHGVVLCVHGERHGLQGEAYFGRTSNAEEIFYQEEMPWLIAHFPRLKIVCEHVTTKVAADFVRQSGPNVVATVTPQHLLYTVGHLLQGCKYHLFCLPVVKYDADVQALRQAVTSRDNLKFFAGTDSAPHTVKATACGCAGGCFTGGIAPQLYAEAFTQAGVDLGQREGQEAFQRFLCSNGAAFYGLPELKDYFTLSQEPQETTLVQTPDGTITPLPVGMLMQPSDKAMLSWRLTLAADV